MSKIDQTINIDKLHIPLAKYRVFSTGSPNAVNTALSDNFNNGLINVFHKNTFRMIYNHITIGNISFNAAAASSGFDIQANRDMQSFVLVYVTHGRMDVRTANKTYSCIPGKLASLLDFEQPSTICVEPFYNNITLRFMRPAIEQTLERLAGKPLRKPLIFRHQIDLSQPGPRRLLAILNQVIAMFEQDTGLAREPLLVGQYEQLVLTALLTCLEHNAREHLLATPPPAPPKVVTLVESFLAANVDKPLSLGDLTSLTGMSGRSIQLAFKKYRGYSPSRFLRECRLSRARDMLRRAAPGTSLLSVALASGFASQSLFCRLYRERFGETPSETAAKA